MVRHYKRTFTFKRNCTRLRFDGTLLVAKLLKERLGRRATGGKVREECVARARAVCYDIVRQIIGGMPQTRTGAGGG